uniref:Uncharacterized protein n=1 Tax=Cacopsylla melanoneura TaxID=428564 RepID=A0A8D9EQD6_9HEMI
MKRNSSVKSLSCVKSPRTGFPSQGKDFTFVPYPTELWFTRDNSRLINSGSILWILAILCLIPTWRWFIQDFPPTHSLVGRELILFDAWLTTVKSTQSAVT